MKKEYKVIILGKIPPPYYGPAIATDIILNSDVRKYYDLLHVDTRINKTMSTFGKFGLNKIIKLSNIYLIYLNYLLKPLTKIVLIPISQSSSGLYKDAVFIIFGLLLRKKIIIHLRGSSLLNMYENTHKINRVFFKSILSRVSGAIVLGEKLKYIFYQFLPEDKIFVVPNGANYKIPARSKPNKSLRVLYLGNLQSSKGIEDVLNAIQICGNKKYNMELDVVGSLREKDLKLQFQKISKNGYIKINYHGEKDSKNKFEYYSKSDLFIFTPREPEGHPWTIIEAMAAGLPIISTDQGAIAESVLNGINGYIVEPNNPYQIAEKIKFLNDNPEVLKKMGICSRKIYEDKYTEEKMVSNLVNVFNRVIEYS